ncbi:TPA: hypothetical protein DCW54_01465 [Candidatus Dependentiae bacterium]|nr:hypothetical protein [Candidatus Dependentiae bacterium]
MATKYLGILFTIVAIPCIWPFSTFSAESDKNTKELIKLHKKLATVEESISLEANTIKNKIAQKFPLKKQQLSFYTIGLGEYVAPIVLFSDVQKTPTNDEIKKKIQDTVQFVVERTSESDKKALMLEKLKTESMLNQIKCALRSSTLETTTVPIQNDLIENLIRRRNEIEVEAKKHLMITNIREGHKEFYINRCNNPYDNIMDTLGNFSLVLQKLYGDVMSCRLNEKPQPLPYFRLLVKPNQDARKFYIKMLEQLTNKINFNQVKPSIFDAFNIRGKYNQEASGAYNQHKAKLTHKLFLVHKAIGNILARLKREPTTPKPQPIISHMFEICIETGKQSNASSQEISKLAAELKTIKDDPKWEQTNQKLLKEQNIAEISLFLALNNYADGYIAFANDPTAMKGADQRFQDTQIISFCVKLFEDMDITIQQRPAPGPHNIHRGLLAVLFIIDLCQKINGKAPEIFAKICNLNQQKNTLIEKIKALEVQTKEFTPEEQEDENDSIAHANVKNIAHIESTGLTPATLRLTKKLKKERQLARYLINPTGTNFNNQLSSAEASLFHNLPLSLLKHPEIETIRSLVAQNINYPKPTSVICRKSKSTLLFWIPVIMCYQENNKQKTEKGTIELFLSTEDKTIFHIWFKKSGLLNNLPPSLLNKIEAKLEALDPAKASAFANASEIKELIPAKNGWALFMPDTNKGTLLLNKNENDTQVNWIFYQ